MSIPEKEFLSKKKYIYEVICFSDGRISVERRAIAYLNQSYIYAIVPGDDELLKIRFGRIHDSEDIKTVLDDLFLAKRRSFEASSYFWERLRETNKLYLQKQIEQLKENIERAKLTYDVQRRTFEASIETYAHQLKELENDS